MERIECERRIAEKAKEFFAIYKEYNPEGDYLAVWVSDGCIVMHNRYFNETSYADREKPISAFQRKEDTDVRSCCVEYCVKE